MQFIIDVTQKEDYDKLVKFISSLKFQWSSKPTKYQYIPKNMLVATIEDRQNVFNGIISFCKEQLLKNGISVDNYILIHSEGFLELPNFKHAAKDKITYTKNCMYVASHYESIKDTLINSSCTNYYDNEEKKIIFIQAGEKIFTNILWANKLPVLKLDNTPITFAGMINQTEIIAITNRIKQLLDKLTLLQKDLEESKYEQHTVVKSIFPCFLTDTHIIIHVPKRSVVLNKWEFLLGKGTIHILRHDLSNITWDSDTKFNMYRNSGYGSYDIHPHICGGKACYGECTELILKATTVKDYAQLIFILSEYANQINTEDSAGANIVNYPSRLLGSKDAFNQDLSIAMHDNEVSLNHCLNGIRNGNTNIKEIQLW